MIHLPPSFRTRRARIAASVALAVFPLSYAAYYFSQRLRTPSEYAEAAAQLYAATPNHELARSWAERARRWQPLPARAAGTPQQHVLWEAERPQSSNFPSENPFAPADERERALLFGGAWIGAEDPGRALWAEYQVAVPRAATYQLYVRKFWKHGPFQWRFGDSPWQRSDERVNLLDDVALRKHVSANWVHLGEVPLEQATVRFRVELLSETGAAAFDAFLLTDGPFSPMGQRLPGAPKSAAPEGFFAFEPGSDRFEESPLDMRVLNEAFAGEGGFIRARGDQLVHSATGQPARFWAVNVGPDSLHQTDAALNEFARRLAKSGVNLVRFHGRLWEESAIDRLDRHLLDRLHSLFAALKREGIYLELSIYFPLWLELDERRHGFRGYAGQPGYALLFFNERFESIVRGWWKQLLLEKNPYTGTTLAQDPALALIELINEDSLLFWTFDSKSIPAPQMALVEERFSAWLAKKYGDVGAARRAWNGSDLPGDEPSNGRLTLLPLWKVIQDRSLRAQDTAEFLTSLEVELYRRMYRYLREEIGYPASIVCGNWQTAHAEVLGPSGKYATAAVCDVMDRHGYYGGRHEGAGAEYSVARGQEYDDASSLLLDWSDPDHAHEHPSLWPILDPTYNGKPSIVSEVNWTFPNRFRTELPVLAAAYGSLQGTDGVFFFATNAPRWAASLSKFSVSDPSILGQFPGAARLYRRALIRPAPQVAAAHRSERDLNALAGLRLDPLASLVGRVDVQLGGNAAAPDARSPQLDESIDRSRRRLTSATKELVWDWGRGVVLLAAPSAQGAIGFLGKYGPIELADVRIECALSYASVLVVPIDDAPLSRSQKILVQVMSEATNTAFATEPARGMRRILDAGHSPILVRQLSGGILLKRGDVARLQATALDANGYPVQVLTDVTSGIPWTPDALYYVVEPKK